MNTMNTNLNLSWDRVFKLEPMDGKAKNVSGMFDPRLFTGENKLHAIKDIETCLWTMKYDKGILPPQLKQTFTTFTALRKFVEHYYKSRNIVVTEIID